MSVVAVSWAKDGGHFATLWRFTLTQGSSHGHCSNLGVYSASAELQVTVNMAAASEFEMDDLALHWLPSGEQIFLNPRKLLGDAPERKQDEKSEPAQPRKPAAGPEASAKKERS